MILMMTCICIFILKSMRKDDCSEQLLQTKDKGLVLERICVATDHDILAIFRFWSFSASISCCCSKNIFLQSSRTTTKGYQELLNELKAHLCHKGREKSFMQ